MRRWPRSGRSAGYEGPLHPRSARAHLDVIHSYIEPRNPVAARRVIARIRVAAVWSCSVYARPDATGVSKRARIERLRNPGRPTHAATSPWVSQALNLGYALSFFGLHI